MNRFKAVFTVELKRAVETLKILIAIVFTVVALLLVQVGINQYKGSIDDMKKFRDFEQFKISQYTTYTQYGAYGFRLLFIPSPYTIPFINSGLFSKASTFIDSGERLKIYNPLKGENLFIIQKTGSDFGGMLFFFGTLLLLFYGYETFSNRKYLKFVISITGKKSTYSFTIFSRLIILTLLLLSILASAYLLIILNGVILPIRGITMNLVLTAVILSWSFYLLGVVLGTLKTKGSRLASILIAWVLLVYFFPMVINSLIRSSTRSMTPIYQMEMDKLKLLMDFERKVIDKVGRLKENEWNRKAIHDLYRSYLDSEFKQILEKEKKILSQMEKAVSDYQLLSMFLPSTYYRCVTDEIGSSGYLNLIDFYRYSLEMKVDFFMFYARKKFFSNHREVESFIKGDENLYFAESRLPLNFMLGTAANLFYLLLLLFAAYHRFKRVLEGKKGTFAEFEIDIQPGHLNVLLTGDPVIKNHPYNYFAGLKRVPAVTVQGIAAQETGFVYLPDPTKFPGTMARAVKKILTAGKNTADMATFWEILYEYAKSTNKVILFDDFFNSLKRSDTEKIKNDIHNNGIQSLYICGNEYLALSIADHLIFSTEDETVQPVKLINNR
jgi:hypothetical protein